MTRKTVIGAVGALIGLPIALVFIAVGSYYAAFYAVKRANGTIVSSGRPREYLLYVPKGYDATRPTPLVTACMPRMLWPAHQRETSHWDRLADKHGFIVVYPSGTTPWGGGTGVLPKIWLLRPEAVVKENGWFISELIDTLEVVYNIDPTRIYANGFSNGGAMTFALSCELAHRLAAVGTVSAAQDQQPSSWCGDSEPVPLINFHGTAYLVPYNGGRVWASPRPFPSVRAWTAEWGRRNGCDASPISSAVAANVTRLEYTHCADDAAVVLYSILGGGHAWPGGKPLPGWLVGHTSHSIDATTQRWGFFREHRPQRR